jgi:glyoxylase-like metal-dependent hydrolase (beta-lactamase superfamily II)
VAFVGDVAGVRIDGGFVLPPTPPPDIDIEQWRRSLDAIEAWSPDTIVLTHFGPTGNVRPHLETLWSNLQEMAGWARQTLDEPGSDEERGRTFADRLKGHMRKEMTDLQIAAYPVAAPFEQLWLGLARYWRRKTS